MPLLTLTLALIFLGLIHKALFNDTILQFFVRYCLQIQAHLF